MRRARSSERRRSRYGAAASQIVASLVGIEEATAQTVHARHTWRADSVLFDRRFRDILVKMPDGRRAVDYEHFHELEP